MKYDYLLFDADDTLFDFKKSEREAFKNTMLEFHYAYDESFHLPLYQQINTAIWKEFENKFITQEQLKTERFRRFSDKLQTGFDASLFAEAYIRNLAEASFLYEESSALIESLHKDYKLAIITNGLKDVQNRRIEKSGISKYFSTIIISEEAGVSKPDAAIFEHAFKNTSSYNKDRVLMIGDSLSSDIRGGYHFGIHTCWYNPSKASNPTELIPTYEISSLMQLKDILNS